MKINRRTGTIAGLLLVLGMLLGAACSGSDGDDSRGDGASGRSTTTEEATTDTDDNTTTSSDAEATTTTTTAPAVETVEYIDVAVSNMVTNGQPAGMVEAPEPQYFRSEPIVSCRDEVGCHFDTTPLATGQSVRLTCWTIGEDQTNGQVTPADDGNPDMVEYKDIWFWSVDPTSPIDEGFLSQVFVTGVPENVQQLLASCDD